MTLNGEMALILRYFTELGSFRRTLRKSGWQSHNYAQFTIIMSSSKRKRFQRLHSMQATRVRIPRRLLFLVYIFICYK